MPKKQDRNVNIPSVIIDPTTKTEYKKGDLLGLGGFARCYKLQNTQTGATVAGKIVSKKVLVKDHQKEKMSQEIEIHRSLNHKHIVGFYSFFEDHDNVYVLLELCEKKSLMELHKRRKAITEPETRYFMQQIAQSVHYLHNRKIIHRDLKLGNLFINKNMDVKVGDFGLATRVEYEGERKKTLCGTPNYIAPEVLYKTGHSYEVDLWSLGCIMYTLLCGKPPFETDSLQETYRKIKRNDYTIPDYVSAHARKLMVSLLQADPKKRPTISAVLKDDFMLGYTPRVLPASCLTMAPRTDTLANISSLPIHSRKPLGEVNAVSAQTRTPTKKPAVPPRAEPVGENADVPVEHNYLLDLHEQLKDLIKSCPNERDAPQEDEAEDPQLMPLFWISKWVDYSDKYGLGYQLSDDSKGVMFNDGTKIVMLNNEQNLHYIEKNKEHYHSIKDYPSSLKKKVTLLHYFSQYMKAHLLKTGAELSAREEDELCRLPHLKNWFRTRSAIVMYLTNGTLQINFFDDHTKVILCPLLGAVSYIDEARNFRTFRMSGIKKYGCSEALFARISYAQNMVERFLSGKSGSSKVKKPTAVK